MRSDSGSGPWIAWDADLYESGELVAGGFEYDAPGPGSYVAWTWPRVAVDAARALELRIGPNPLEQATIPFTAAPPVPSLTIPKPRLSLDGGSVQWPAIAGVATYRCLISGQTSSSESFGTAPSCDISSLAPGSYIVQIQALSIDLQALGADANRAPLLPARFDVAEGRLGILIPSAGGTPLQLIAAGGSLRFNGVAYIAVWASIVAPDGTPAAHGWNMSVSLIGGEVTDSTQLMPYPAGAERSLETGMGYSLRATPGDYFLVAYDGGTELFVPVNVGAPAQLAEASGVTATGDVSGGASVTWNGVAGATSYLVRAYDLSGLEVGSGWTGTPAFDFPDGTFTSGKRYDVYVLATDADMIGGAAPMQVGASETAYPASFTAP